MVYTHSVQSLVCPDGLGKGVGAGGEGGPYAVCVQVPQL